MKVSVPKETAAGERRVALVPEVVQAPGERRGRGRGRARRGRGRAPARRAYERPARRSAGRRLRAATSSRRCAPPSAEEIGRAVPRRGADRLPPAADRTARSSRALAQAGVTAFAMEAIPRITRAQSMDALSSPGDGRRLPRRADRRAGAGPLLPDAHDRRRHGQAGEGAGARRRRRRAAGDRDRAAARRASCTAFDVRSAVKEQIESLGREVRRARHRARGRRGRGRLRASSSTEDEQQRQRERSPR